MLLRLFCQPNLMRHSQTSPNGFRVSLCLSLYLWYIYVYILCISLRLSLHANARDDDDEDDDGHADVVFPLLSFLP